MPLPRALALFNRVVSNNLLAPLAHILPNFALVVHRGRVSGREYRTLVNFWKDDESAIVALTYGSEVDWLKNLRAARGGAIVNRGTTWWVGSPVVIGDKGMERMPGTVKVLLEAMGVDEFAVMPLIKPDLPT